MALPVTLGVPAPRLQADVKVLSEARIPALALEAAEALTASAIAETARTLKAVPLLALIAPLGDEGGVRGTLTHADPAVRRAALAAIGSAASLASELHIPRLVLPLAAEKEPGDREARTLLLCRALHGLLRQLVGLRILVMPAAPGPTWLDPEVFGWIRGELPAIGLSIDTGVAGAAEAAGGALPSTWLSAHDDALGMVFLSDHDAAGRAVLPGCGVGSFLRWRDALGRSRPRALRGPSGTSPGDLVASASEVTARWSLDGDADTWLK